MSCFFYLVNGSTDAAGIAAAEDIAALCNGTLVSVTKQVFEDNTDTYGDATLNGGSDRTRILFRNSVKETDNITIPLIKHSINKREVEGLFENGTHAFVRKDGGVLGQVVHMESSQIVDGPPEANFPA